MTRVRVFLSMRPWANPVHSVAASATRLRQALIFLLLASGIALQLRQYLANRSLSLDESFLALNIIHRPLSALFRPLDFNQGAPPVFLMAQKLVVLVLGKDEHSLRLVPLMAACLSVVLFAFLANRVLNRRVAPVGVALFILSSPLIYYASANKPYSTDVLVSVFAYWLILKLQFDKATHVLAFASFAAIASWISFPALFTVLGISATVAGRSLSKRRWEAGIPGFVAGGACVLSFTLLYYLSVQKLGHLQASLAGRPGVFIGTTSSSTSGLLDVAGNVRYVTGIGNLVVFGHDLEKPITVAVLLFCVTGFLSLLRRNTETAVILVASIPFLGFAAYAHKYPLLGRTLLFLLPTILLLLAEGLGVAAKMARPFFGRSLVAFVAAAIFVSTAVEPLKHISVPRSEEDMKPVMAYLAHHQRPNDTLYIYYPSQYGFRYYLECSCAPRVVLDAYLSHLWPAKFAAGGREQYAPTLESIPPRFLVARFRDRDPHSYRSDFLKLRGRRRVWILFSDIPASSRETLSQELDSLGRLSATFRGGPDESSAVVHLYNFAQ